MIHSTAPAHTSQMIDTVSKTRFALQSSPHCTAVPKSLHELLPLKVNHKMHAIQRQARTLGKLPRSVLGGWLCALRGCCCNIGVRCSHQSLCSILHLAHKVAAHPHHVQGGANTWVWRQKQDDVRIICWGLLPSAAPRTG